MISDYPNFLIIWTHLWANDQGTTVLNELKMKFKALPFIAIAYSTQSHGILTWTHPSAIPMWIFNFKDNDQ